MHFDIISSLVFRSTSSGSQGCTITVFRVLMRDLLVFLYLGSGSLLTSTSGQKIWYIRIPFNILPGANFVRSHFIVTLNILYLCI